MIEMPPRYFKRYRFIPFGTAGCAQPLFPHLFLRGVYIFGIRIAVLEVIT